MGFIGLTKPLALLWLGLGCAIHESDFHDAVNFNHYYHSDYSEDSNSYNFGFGWVTICFVTNALGFALTWHGMQHWVLS